MFSYDKWIRYEKEGILRGEFGLMRKQWVVYVIYINERLAYIGHTNNLSQRLNGHRIGFYKNTWHTRWGKCVDIYIKAKFPRKLGQEAMIEKRLICRLKPPLNKRYYKQFQCQYPFSGE